MACWVVKKNQWKFSKRPFMVVEEGAGLLGGFYETEAEAEAAAEDFKHNPPPSAKEMAEARYGKPAAEPQRDRDDDGISSSARDDELDYRMALAYVTGRDSVRMKEMAVELRCGTERGGMIMARLERECVVGPVRKDGTREVYARSQSNGKDEAQ